MAKARDLPSAGGLTKTQKGSALDAPPSQRRGSSPAPPAVDNSIVFSFRAPASLRKRMRQLSLDLDRPMQELCEEAFEQMLEAHGR